MEASYDPGNGPVLPGKSEGGYISGITFDEPNSGEVVGRSVSLYELMLPAESTIAVNVQRQSGAIQPQAYLYRDLASLSEGAAGYVMPEPGYVYGEGRLQIRWTATVTATYYLVVQAADPDNAGGFNLVVSCESGPCASSPAPDDATEQQLQDFVGSLSYATPNGGHGIGRFNTVDFDLERELRVLEGEHSMIVDCLFAEDAESSCGNSRIVSADLTEVLAHFAENMSVMFEELDGVQTLYAEYNYWDDFKEVHGIAEDVILESTDNLTPEIKDILTKDYQRVYDLIADPTNLAVVSSVPNEWYCCNAYIRVYVLRSDGIYLYFNFDHSD